MSLLRHAVVRRASQLVLGLVLVVAALAKLVDPGALATQVHNFHLVPLWSENLLAMALPWIELLAGLSLLLGIRPRAGAWVGAAAMLVFTVAVAVSMARGLDFACGCFGTADATRIGGVKLAQNLGLLALAVVGSLRSR
jgi:uncharacterized membrane protein YphA (DoxX/SURF4 family)